MTEAEVTRLNTTLRASAPSPPLRARKPLLRYGIVVNGRQRSIVNELGNARVDLYNLSFLFCKRVSRKITKIRDHKIGNVFPKLAIRETLQTSETLWKSTIITRHSSKVSKMLSKNRIEDRSWVWIKGRGTSVERITVLTLKRHLHLGDPRSGRWISEDEVRRRLCNSNPADSPTRQRLDKCRWEKIGGDSRPRDGQDNGMFRVGLPVHSDARDTAR